MKKLSFHVLLVSVVALAALLASLTAIIGADNKDDLPAYLSTATYITSAKCRMCHSKQAKAWDTTLHASFKDQLPWEKDKKPTPDADVVYRHVTAPNTDVTAWSEKSIACEACHGPGSAHFKPAEGQSRKSLIVKPTNLATIGEKVSVCGRCHGQYVVGEKKQRFVANFLPGQDIMKMDDFKLDPVKPGAKMEQLNELSGSKHMTNGVVCITCHSAHDTTADNPHQLCKPVIELCTSCHKDKTMAGHAPKAAATDTCATCHMPDGIHTFVKPVK